MLSQCYIAGQTRMFGWRGLGQELSGYNLEFVLKFRVSCFRLKGLRHDITDINKVFWLIPRMTSTKASQVANSTLTMCVLKAYHFYLLNISVI